LFDICIIGSGPSGSTVARLLDKKYRVLLLEKRYLDDTGKPEKFPKSCGGLLAPDAQVMIAKLGLGLPKSVLEDPQLFVVRSIDLDSLSERYYQRHYININRRLFDTWLVSMIGDNTDIRFNSIFTNYVMEGNGYKINYIKDNRSYSEKARMIIAADGAYSKLRRTAFPETKQPLNYIAIQKYYESNEIHPYYSAIFDKEVTDYYSWTIPKEGCVILGTALRPGKMINDKMRLLETGLKKYGFNFGKLIKTESSYITRPVSSNHIVHGKDKIALLGEAAGFISPSSGEGLSYAIKSAIMLSESINSHDDKFILNYKKRILELKFNILLKNLKSIPMYSPLLRNLIFKTGIRTVDIKY
jgi:geranylgeranyl diphosphate/geranylgeranyl-bacteriochlorophyllide a reductase